MTTLTLTEAWNVAANVGDIADAIGVPYEGWAGNCHAISLRILRTGLLGDGRVARGTCTGVPAQHSWIVLGDDCYSPHATIADPTLHLWRGDAERGIMVTAGGAEGHVPHGSGSILRYAMPARGSGEIIELTPSQPLSAAARSFLELLGPLDLTGWTQLAHAPVGGWPAGEIFAAMDDTRKLRALIPVDVLGMTTDRNPRGLYW